MNRVVNGSEARQIILEGAKELYEAVKVTMGPTSGNVGILPEYGLPTVTHDGVKVAKSIDLEGDKRIGAELIKAVATQMDDRLGDGTTTVTVLTYHILEAANDLIMMGTNPMLLRQQIEKDAQQALRHIQDLAVLATSKEQLIDIATISSGDSAIGKLIGETVFEVGKDGVVTVEESSGLTIEKDLVEGYSFERGYLSPYFITDSTRSEAVLQNPAIAVCGKVISTLEELTPVLEKLKGRTNLLLIVDDISEPVLGSLVVHKLKGLLNVVVVKSPGFGDQRQQILEDLAALVGATVVNGKETEIRLGSADKVLVTKTDTTIIGGSGDAKPRIAEIKLQLPKATGPEKQQLLKRQADLEGAVAVIRVGGASELEITEKKFRVDDAIFAAKAALEEGTVPGGGTTLLHLADKLDKDSLLAEVLRKPFTVLLDNIGKTPEDYKTITPGQGVDLRNPEKLVDLRKRGIIDPAKTVRQAIENAVSIAATAITMKAIVVPVEKKKDTDVSA